MNGQGFRLYFFVRPRLLRDSPVTWFFIQMVWFQVTRGWSRINGEGERSFVGVLVLACCDIGVNCLISIERVSRRELNNRTKYLCTEAKLDTEPNTSLGRQMLATAAVYRPKLHIGSLLAKITIKSYSLLWGCGALEVDRGFLLCLHAHRVFSAARSPPDAGLFDWMGHLAPTPRKTSG